MSAEHRPVAAFDFDGTIAKRDTLLGFLEHAGGRRRTMFHLARRSPSLIKGMWNAESRDHAKNTVVGGVLRGLSEEQLTILGGSYARTLTKLYRKDMLERISWHRDEGHETVIVSASLVYYLRPVARELGIDDVIGVELAFDSIGSASGGLARPNVRGPEKVRRLEEWWGDRPATELWAYGDSSGDAELLARADHPTRV